MTRFFSYTLLLTLLLTFGSWKSTKDLGSLTTEEMTSGLKTALEQGAGNAVSFLNKPGGYLDTKFRIPFPTDAKIAADKMRKMGFGKQVDQFETQLNRAAEAAAIEAKPIFVNAIKSMSIADAKNILLGKDDAATNYFKGATSASLTTAFSPKIKAALDKAYATKYWTEITTKYNKMPGVKKVQTDLTKFTTDKALEGLFIKMAEEEKDLRSKFATQTNPLLKKVFDWVSKNR